MLTEKKDSGDCQECFPRCNKTLSKTKNRKGEEIIMKARFAILSAISFWLYAISMLVENVMETVVHAKLMESVGNFFKC